MLTTTGRKKEKAIERLMAKHDHLSTLCRVWQDMHVLNYRLDYQNWNFQIFRLIRLRSNDCKEITRLLDELRKFIERLMAEHDHLSTLCHACVTRLTLKNAGPNRVNYRLDCQKMESPNVKVNEDKGYTRGRQACVRNSINRKKEKAVETLKVDYDHFSTLCCVWQDMHVLNYHLDYQKRNY